MNIEWHPPHVYDSDDDDPIVADPTEALLDGHGSLISDAWRAAASRILNDDHLERVHHYPEYLDDPARFQREILGNRLWAAQTHVCEALMKHRRVALRSSRKTGKTHNAAGIVNAFVGSGPCVVITTAATGRQVREYLWSKIRAQHARARRPMPGSCGTTALRVGPEWFAIGFSTDEPENVLGAHAGVRVPVEPGSGDEAGEFERFTWEQMSADRRLLLVIDEAPGVAQALYEAMIGSLSGENTYALIQGNPLIAPDSPHFFARAHQPGSGWHRVHVGGYEPAPGEDELGADRCFHEVPPWLADQRWIDECERLWGRTHPLFRAHVGGLFAAAEGEEMRVIPRVLLESAEARACHSEQGRHLGVDVAREGGDEAVASLWVDGVKSAEHVWSKTSLMRTADMIVAMAARWDVAHGDVHIDSIGIGAGVLDRLRQQGVFVDAVDFGTAPVGDWKHLIGDGVLPRNRRAELHWAVRRAFEEGLGHLPRRWDHSWQQAQWATYSLLDQGRSGTVLTIESKDKISARHGRSPDHWDSDLLAWSRGTVRPSFGLIRRRG